MGGPGRFQAIRVGRWMDTVPRLRGNEARRCDAALRAGCGGFFGDVALVYANDKLFGTADISSVPGSGDVMLAYGLYSGDDHNTAEYEDFTVWGTR